jgi:hypothetical protein
MPSSEVLRYRGAHLRPANNSYGTSSASSSLSPPPPPPGANGGYAAPSADLHGGHTRGQLKKLYQSRNPTHDVGNGYLTTRKLEKKTIKNREKRVRRQYVLEDGRVIEEGDPEVVVDRVEDTLTREEEHETDGLGDDDRRLQRYRLGGDQRQRTQLAASAATAEGDVVDDCFTRTVNTHDVKEDVTTTSVSQNMGRISRRAIDKALREKQPLSEVIERHRNRKKNRGERGYEVHQAPSKPKVIYSTKSHKKIVDTEDVHNISRKLEDGKVHTETIRTQQHEVIDNKAAPDDEEFRRSGSEAEKVIKDKQKYRHHKKDEFTDFYRVPKQQRRGSAGENGVGAAHLVARGPHVMTEEREIEKGEHNWEEVEEKILRNRERMRQKIRAGEASDRADALTKKPLNYHVEEKTRKKETNKWLDHHFGSDYSLLTSSQNGSSGVNTTAANAATTGTLGNNRVLRHHFAGPGSGQVRRSMSFSSIPIKYTNPRERLPHDAGTGEEEEEEEETKTIERRKVIKTKTTTYTPGGKKMVHSSVQHIDEPTQRFYNQSRTVYPTQQRQQQRQQQQQHNHRQYNSTLSLGTPKAEFVIHPEPVQVVGESHRSRRSQHLHGATTNTNDPYCSTQSLNRRRHSYYYGDQSQPSEVEQDRLFRHRRQEEDEVEEAEWQHQHRQHRHRHNHSVQQQQQQQQQQQVQQQQPRAVSSSATMQRQRNRCSEHRQQHHHEQHQQHQQHHHQQEQPHHHRPHIVEERYSSCRSESSPPAVRAKRLVPTLERQITSNNQRVVYRSDSRREESNAGGAAKAAPRRPVYITEFTKEKLYPAKSENNLLSSGGGVGFHSSKQPEHVAKGGGVGYFSQRQQEEDLQARDYLGFRSMERNDGVGDTYRTRHRSVESSSAAESASDSSKKRRQQQQQRSHSFVDAFRPRHHMFQDDFVYDRAERKFVSSSGMRHGHSNLRLDSRDTLTLPSKLRGGGGAKMSPSEAFGGDGVSGLKQWHSREIVHQQEQIEPQKFKTIIFLTGS